MATVVHALVTTDLYYCNAVYVGLRMKVVQRLLFTQNVVACVFTGARHSIGPLLQRLHWLLVQLKLLVMTFKALYSLGLQSLRKPPPPIYANLLPENFREGPSVCTTTSVKSQEVAARKRAFSVAVPQLGNSLPCNFRTAPSPEVFQQGVTASWFWVAFGF